MLFTIRSREKIAIASYCNTPLERFAALLKFQKLQQIYFEPYPFQDVTQEVHP